MSISRSIACAVLALVCVLGTRPVGAQETLTRAKDYYASASYDDALRVLAPLRQQSPDAVDVAAYEVFCLFALGRESDARGAIEAIVRRDPLYHPPADETSPRVRAFFDAVRRPLLPQVIRQRYQDARAALERDDRESAAAEFDRAVRLIDEMGAADDPGLSDLRVLAVGFRDLARMRPAPQSAQATGPAAGETAGTPLPEASAASGAATRPPAPAASAVYDASDRTVTPPTMLSRPLPPWRPSNVADRRRTYKGSIEVVVDADGRVISIVALNGIHLDYVEALVKSTEQWRFRPASREGRPVAYRTVTEIVLDGR